MINVPRYDFSDEAKRIQAGDELAFSSVFRQLYNPVYNRALVILKNHQDAADASQDVFIKVWQKKSKWDPAQGQFLGWFLVLAERTIIDAYRKKKRSQKDIDSIDRHIYGTDNADTDGLTALECIPDRSPDALRSIAADEALRLIEDALLTVPNRNHRLAWILRHFEAYSVPRISEIMNAPRTSCKIWIHRCQIQIREALKATDGYN